MKSSAKRPVEFSAEAQQRFASIPWTAMVAMRNLIIHQYDAVDFTIVWQTIRNDLPQLIRQLEQIAEEDSELTADGRFDSP